MKRTFLLPPRAPDPPVQVQRVPFRIGTKRYQLRIEVNEVKGPAQIIEMPAAKADAS